jgi:hypothetical protein
MLSLKENLLTGKLQACKAYQPERYSSFTANTKGTLHVQKKAGRHKQPLPESVKNEIIKLYKMYRANASYIGKILTAKGYSIDNNRIKEAGLAMSEPKKWHRKKWIRYERILKLIVAR